MLRHLPMAFLAGLKVKKLSNSIAEVTVPFNFLNKNPFNSIYFAVLTMAQNSQLEFYH